MRGRSLGLTFALLPLALVLSLSGCSSGSADGDAARGDRAGRDGGSPWRGPAGKGKGKGKGRPDDRAALETPATPVVVTEVAVDDMQAFLDGSSTLEAEGSVEVVSQATGVVVDLVVEEGDRVGRGDLLARLAYEDLELAERRARSELERLRSEHRRASNLAEQDLIAEQDYQTLEFDLERAEIDWRQRTLELERTRIVAPIDGTVTARMVAVGDLVRQNEAVFQVVDFATLVAPVFVPEKYLGVLRAGQRALVRPPGLDGRTFDGRILRISPIVDSQSGTVKVTVALDSRAGLRPGMFSNVQIVLDTHEGTLVVPKKALVYEDEMPYVFVVGEDGKAEKRRIELGYQDAERAEVLEGLGGGERIVLVGQSALKDGSTVEVREAEGETS